MKTYLTEYFKGDSLYAGPRIYAPNYAVAAWIARRVFSHFLLGFRIVGRLETVKPYK